MSIITGRIGVDEAGNVFVGRPSEMQQLPVAAVTYGDPVALGGGDNLPAGIWEVVSGRLEAAIGGATVRQVMVGP